MVKILLVRVANDAAFYTKFPLFSGILHTAGKRFRRKKARTPASGFGHRVFSQTLFTEG
jgi:hypothetical protein